MIKVLRSEVREPAALKPLRDQGYKHAKKFFVDTPLRERRQHRYFNPYWEKAQQIPVKALIKLFRGKCAWCERRVDPNRSIIDHLRPRWATRGLGNEYAPDHYWWLAFVWDNLYASCPTCNKARGTRFPVKGNRIAGPGEDLSLEEPMMLDPCVDDPQEHLRFEDSGRVTPLTRKGDITIQLLALNRTELVAGRHKSVLALKSVWEEAWATVTPRVKRMVVVALELFLKPEAEFSAANNQAISRLMEASGHEFLAGLTTVPMPQKSSKRQAVQPILGSQTPRFIDEIRLRNFKGIATLNLRAPTTDQRNMDWFMLIGENAAGKSSILQAIALNLMSDVERNRLDLPHRRFIRRGERTSRVEVRFRNEDEPRVLTITRTGGFKSSDPKAGVPVMAYGATRLPPQTGGASTKLPLENLFNPFAPLADASSWLLSLAKQKKRHPEFDYAVRALAALLPGKPRRWQFRAAKDDIIVDPEGPLRELSDGYQSVLALAADMMATLQQHFRGGMEAAEGIVLLDELGAHLHPRWKMRLTTVLREAFPRLQFIATTHDPLCLRGLRNGEIVTIEKTSRGRVFSRSNLPPVEGMRVDQILQSEYFGLRSVLDPEIEKDFDRMYRLKAKPSSLLTPKQRQTLNALESKLASIEVPGSTRTERLMLSEINRYVELEKELPESKARERAWEKTGDRIARSLRKDLGVRL